MLRIKLIGLIFFYALILLIRAEYYSSRSGLENLLKLESFMIENIETFINAEKEWNLKLQNYIEYVENELKIVQNNSIKHFENPLNVWKSIKRIGREWQDFYRIDRNNPIKEEYRMRLEEYVRKSGIRRPDINDLIGAAKGVARLQRTYNLEALHLANGTILGRKISLEMSAIDCFDLGMGLINLEDFKNAAMWLLEARTRLALETEIAIKSGYTNFPYLQDSAILDNLINAVIKIENPKLALWLINDQLSRNQQNENSLENYQIVEQKLRKERRSMERGDKRKTNKQPSSMLEIYEKICRGELRQTPRQQRDLRCSYVNNNVPFCFIAPFKMEVLNIDPFIAFYHEAIYENEIEKILNKAKPTMRRSNVGYKNVSSEIRMSQQTWLWHNETEFLSNISQRLVDITGLSFNSTEPLQVASYGVSSHYGPHYDFSEDGFTFGGRGNRILTALFYINNVELGGATVFPSLKLAVPPIRRSVVVWYNMHRSLKLDYRMVHGACPVLKGSKWICTEWFHTVDQEFKRPCGLKPDGYISKPKTNPLRKFIVNYG